MLREATESLLRRLWYAPAPGPGLRLLRAVLAPLSGLTAFVATRRRDRIARLPAPPRPTVVVGNFVAGGAGKTPLVAALVGVLGERGWRPGIVASGYGARRSDARIVAASDDAAEHGDEPVLLARTTGHPVAAGRDRAAAVTALLAGSPEVDVIVSDDGLQHPTLARDVELAVFDERGAGNARLLPAGPLRAPIAQARSMHALLLNGAARAPIDHPRVFRFHVEPRRFVKVDGSGAPVAAAGFAARIGDDEVVAIAATGAPGRFFDTLRALGLRPRCIELPDHATIDAARIRAIRAPWILMTTKDAVKCAAWADRRCWALEVHAALDPDFVDWLIGTIRGRTTA